jgi:hypothetical protein
MSQPLALARERCTNSASSAGLHLSGRVSSITTGRPLPYCASAASAASKICGGIHMHPQEVNLLRNSGWRDRLMDVPGRPDKTNLARLERLIELAESVGVYLDINGLGTFRAADVPAWYNGLSERERWAVQAEFWEAIARAGANHPGVFAYNLMNEPLVSTERLAGGTWTLPKELDGLCYVEYIDIDPAGRRAPDIARAWAHQMTGAIRMHDPRHLVTVGHGRKLKIDAHDIGAEALHLVKVAFHLRPALRPGLIPVLLKEAEPLIPRIVEAPGNERRAAGVERKAASVRIHRNPGR